MEKGKYTFIKYLKKNIMSYKADGVAQDEMLANVR
jgi:hypothetical protein